MKPLLSFFAAGCLLWLPAVLPVQAGEAYTVTLAFESDQLDLDSGVVSSDVLDPSSTSGTPDIQVAYNATRANKAVIMLIPAEGREMVFLENTGLEAISTDMVSGLIFAPETNGHSITVFDTMVVKTDTGAYYKLGNLSESETSVTFDYQLVE